MTLREFPSVAPASQRWADRWNPVGIQRRTLGLNSNDEGGLPPVLRSDTAEGGQSKTLREQKGYEEVRQVLDCASPLALW